MQEKILDILRALIAFPSVSHRSNLDIADYIEAYLKGEGIRVTRLLSPHEPKAALLASIGPADAPGIMLSGHMDVVPAEGQNWTTDAFTPDLRGGRLYGRGATDMKGFLAVALAHVPQFIKAATATP